MRRRLLLVEDDTTIGRNLTQALIGNGYDVVWCTRGEEALRRLNGSPYDVMLLDLGLPDTDGVDVAREARAADPDLLLIALTARTDEIDVISCLEAGADDYLTKPFSMTVLLARLRAHLRRRGRIVPADHVVAVGALTVDFAGRRCLVDGHEVALRPKEFELLGVLVRCPEIAVSRRELMRSVWDENWHGSTKTLDVTVAHLRSVLASAPGGGRPDMPSITTLRGHGYRLDPGDG